MKVLIVYDSVYGNTEKIARAISDAFTSQSEVSVHRAAEANPGDIKNLDLLIVGAPTQAGRPTQPVQKFLDQVPADALRNLGLASFDTRVKSGVAKLFGYAAGRIAKTLEKKGGKLTVQPEGFLVSGTQGPVLPGELERATAWGREILEKQKASNTE